MFEIGDLVTLRNSVENNSYLELAGQVGRVVDFSFSVGPSSKQFVRVQWGEVLYTDLKAERFEKIKKIY